jgi:hypothetical protein
MIKILAIVIGVHLLSFSFIWVGFPIIKSKERAVFYYSQLQMPLIPNEFIKENNMPIKVNLQADQDLWNRQRVIDKPRR